MIEDKVLAPEKIYLYLPLLINCLLDPKAHHLPAAPDKARAELAALHARCWNQVCAFLLGI